MKQPVIQRFRATTEQGSVVRVCCGPALAALPGVVAYEPVGKPAYGVCHHSGPEVRFWKRAQADLVHVRAWLARRAGRLF